MDANNDGEISPKEFEDGMRELGVQVDAILCWDLLSMGDTNGDGVLDRQEIQELFFPDLANESLPARRPYGLLRPKL